MYAPLSEGSLHLHAGGGLQDDLAAQRCWGPHLPLGRFIFPHFEKQIYGAVLCTKHREQLQNTPGWIRLCVIWNVMCFCTSQSPCQSTSGDDSATFYWSNWLLSHRGKHLKYLKATAQLLRVCAQVTSLCYINSSPYRSLSICKPLCSPPPPQLLYFILHQYRICCSEPAFYISVPKGCQI